VSVGIFPHGVSDSEMYFGTRKGGSTRPRRLFLATSARFSAPSYEGSGVKARSARPLYSSTFGKYRSRKVADPTVGPPSRSRRALSLRQEFRSLLVAGSAVRVLVPEVVVD
jgi:hypothetical protein